jgi:hypothetical protein
MMQVQKIEMPTDMIVAYKQDIDLQNNDYVTILYMFRILDKLNQLSIAKLVISKEGFFLDQSDKRIQLNESKTTNSSKKRI